MCRCRTYRIDAFVCDIANAIKHVGLQEGYLSTINAELNFREVIRGVYLFSQIPLLSWIIVVKYRPNINSIQSGVEVMCPQ